MASATAMVVWVGVMAGATAWSEARADDCNTFAQFTEGAKITMTHYDKKGKSTGSSTTTTQSVSLIGSGRKATLHGEMVDPKGNPIQSFDYDTTCSGDQISVDMRAMVPQAMMRGREGFDVSFKGSNLVYPTQPVAGASLPDAMMHISFAMRDMPPGMPARVGSSRIEFKSYNRRIVGEETVTTPAGTFKAWRIEHDSDMDSNAIIQIHTTGHGTDWYVPGLGLVKIVSSDKEGKMTATSELTAFVTP